MIKKYKNVITMLFLFGSLSLFASHENLYPKNFELDDYFSESFSRLKEQVCGIQSQYVSVTSRLAKIEYDIPLKFQCFSNLFQTANSRFYVDNNAYIYYDTYELSDFEKFFLCQEGDFYGNFDSSTQFASLANLIAVSNQVVRLEKTISFLTSRLNTLSDAISSMSSKPSVSKNSLSNPAAVYNSLDRMCSDLTSVIEVNDDGSVVIAKSSPIVGDIEPVTGASYWQPAVNGEWNKAGNTFRVSRDTQLESVTLYCDNVSRIILPQNVYIAACQVNSGIPQIVEYAAASINTSNFPRITYSFSSPVPILADRDYLLCVKKLGNAPLYVYTCQDIRFGEFYKPYGAPDEPRGGGDDAGSDDDYVPTPRSGLTPQQFFYEYLSACWSLTYTTQEIWSIFKFTDDESFTFTHEGLMVESGNITVGGSEVITSSSLGDMFVSVLQDHLDALNSEITWNMFCDDLKNRLITIAGGTVTGPLTVSNLKINGSGDWTVGSTNNPSDIVIAHPSGKISAPNGDLNLLAMEGGNIQAQSFLQLQNTTQCGIIEIPINMASSSPVTCSGLTSNAIILLTPRQETTTAYWTEINATNSTFKVIRPSEAANSERLLFNYLIIRK
ncbi:hypothetical protein IKZ40_04730 [bacterium]|nr:hypothetical protein [bacterium]